eukprot:scaffold114388_cov35-Prasinocladus_malaysianus.AAC.1
MEIAEGSTPRKAARAAVTDRTNSSSADSNEPMEASTSTIRTRTLNGACWTAASGDDGVDEGIGEVGSAGRAGGGGGEATG